MAFPSVSATATTVITGGTSEAVNLPASIASGDLLLIICDWSSSTFGSLTMTAPSGWSTLLYEHPMPGQSNSSWAVYYKTASGSEGSTATVTIGSTASDFAAIAYRIAAGTWSGTPVIGTTATGASGTLNNPPSLTSGFGAVDPLWIAVGQDASHAVATSA